MNNNELKHYGVKGQKWGVRRSKEELKYDKYSLYTRGNKQLKGLKTKNGITVKGMTDHIAEQASARKVQPKYIKDALENPIDIGPKRYDKYGRPSYRFIGEKAIVNVNPDNGLITTVWTTGERIIRKLKERNNKKYV